MSEVRKNNSYLFILISTLCCVSVIACAGVMPAYAAGLEGTSQSIFKWVSGFIIMAVGVVGMIVIIKKILDQKGGTGSFGEIAKAVGILLFLLAVLFFISGMIESGNTESLSNVANKAVDTAGSAVAEIG